MLFDRSRIVAVCVVFLFSTAEQVAGGDLAPPKREGAIRVATFNAALNRSEAGKLSQELQSGSNSQARAIATIIRDVRPDILLLNELDYSTEVDNAAIFHEKYLAEPSPDLLDGKAWEMPHRFSATVNTGEPSGMDLNNDQTTDGPEDAWGFGRFPGQYGMAIFSRFEIDRKNSRTFQNLLWSELPGALEPVDPRSQVKFYSPDVWKRLRLSSKSFWDVVVRTPGHPIHILASHPTPPVFDGPEDRNGCRNHDEIRMLVEYIRGNPIRPIGGTRDDFWLDDQGRSGALETGSRFVVSGDLNCDPVDGNSRREAIQLLLGHPRIQSTPVPKSQGAIHAAKLQGQSNLTQVGDASSDTGDFDDKVVGNLRIDYVLPSVGFEIVGSGVAWPDSTNFSPEVAKVIERLNQASDHHLVWVDLVVTE